LSDSRFTYELPEEVLEGLSIDEQNEMRDAWNTAVSPFNALQDNRKDIVRTNVMSGILSDKDKQSINTDRAPIQTSRPVARIYQMRMQMVSVAAAIVIAVGFIFSSPPVQYRADTGTSEVTNVSLADGSTVTLAPGSRISVIDGFSEDHRRVKLHGEAFFDVSEGSTEFVVETFDSQTTVLGTRFAVKAWPGSMEAATQVLVKDGRVSVAHNEESELLTAGEMVRVESNSVSSPIAVNADQSLSWVDGGFFYDGELIGNVIEDVERRFDLKIKAPSSIRLRRISIQKKEATDAGEFLGDVSATIGVRYRANANGFEMYLN